MERFDIDIGLVGSIVDATNAGLEMADVRCRPVAISRYLLAPRHVSVMVGLVGDEIGNVTLNVSPKAACFMAGRFLGEEYDAITEDVLDACGEITNILAGGLMNSLSQQGQGFRSLSCPSTVVGANYSLFHFRGARSVSVSFEIPDIPMGFTNDRLFAVVLAILAP